MEIVLIFSERWNLSPFELLKIDIDDFIIMCNYLMNLKNNVKPEPKKAGEQVYKKVNNETATGGWW